MNRQLSYWEENYFFSDLDLVIVGSGIVGLNAGIEFLKKNPNSKVLILERSQIPYGASTRNAGFACFGSPSEILEDLKNNSYEEVFGLFAQRFEGIQALRERTKNYNIDYEPYGGNELFLEKNPIQPDQLFMLNEQIQKFVGLKNYFRFAKDKISNDGLVGFQQLIYTEYEACIHPTKMIGALSQIYQNLGGKILTTAEIVDWNEESDKVIIQLSNRYSFESKKLLFAVNGFAEKLFPKLQIKAARNQVMIIESNVELKLKGCYHYDNGYVYFRKIYGKLLIGGGRNQDLETEYSDQMEINPIIKEYLLDFVKKHIFPNNNFRISNHWVGILGLGPEKKPIIEKLSSHIFVAIRLSGVGIAIGTLIGNKVAELISNEVK